MNCACKAAWHFRISRGRVGKDWLCYSFSFLPPASEGWGKVIFSLCVSAHTTTGGGSTPSEVWMGGAVPHPRSEQGGGVPHPRFGWWRGGNPGYPPGLDGYPPQDWMVYTPPPVRTGWGIPQPGLDGEWGTPPPPVRTGWGTSSQPELNGVPPLAKTGWGTPT